MTSFPICVGVLFGGDSGEHNVSIKSAITVINALKSGSNSNRFEVFPIYIDSYGRWWPPEIACQALKKGSKIEDIEFPLPLPNAGFKELPKGSERVQVWYPVLHGPNGEDGTIQGLFKLMKKPFVGAGVLGSSVGMDKIAMKAAFAAECLPQVPYLAISGYKTLSLNLQSAFLERVEKEINYPCFIKPANLGSSVGITKANTKEDLIKGIQVASKLDERIIIELAVIARELECAVLGNTHLEASEVGEVRFESDWYDFEAKYAKGTSELLIPAPISKNVKARVKELTLKACKAITVKGMARVDFFYKEDNDDLLINEINTLPGFTSQSMYPRLWDASGVTLEQLVAKLVESAGQ